MKNPDRNARVAPTPDSLMRVLECGCSEAATRARAILEIGRELAAGSRDVRLRRIIELSRELGESLGSIDVDAYRALLGEVGAPRVARQRRDAVTGRIFARLLSLPAPNAARLGEEILDVLIEELGARRGYVLFCSPVSTEAEVVAARNLGSTNLSLDEHTCSRTVVAEMVRRGSPIALVDASADERFSGLTSVRALSLHSVLAAPLLRGDRVVGGIYLEDDTRSGVFGPVEIEIAEAVARFAVFYLHATRLLPTGLEREDRIFLDGDRVFAGIVGRHETLARVLDVVRRIADLPATVLIEGESGTGKDLIARALHFAGARRQRPFVTINCAAIPEGLLESELFGHERGAFTGATSRQKGRVETADGGTLFLDEVSELPPPLQAKLLRFLQSGELQRLGGREPISADVRIVAATSKDLKKLMAEGRFQEALYFRLNVIPLRLPALRERRSDIRMLVDHFLDKYAALFGRSVGIDEEVYDRLQHYDYPGNVRELENIVQRLVALTLAPAIRLGDLPREVLDEPPPRTLAVHLAGGPTGPRSLAELQRRRERLTASLAEQEREMVLQAVAEAKGKVALAAERLGCHRVTLYRILARGAHPPA